MKFGRQHTRDFLLLTLCVVKTPLWSLLNPVACLVPLRVSHFNNHLCKGQSGSWYYWIQQLHLMSSMEIALGWVMEAPRERWHFQMNVERWPSPSPLLFFITLFRVGRINHTIIHLKHFAIKSKCPIPWFYDFNWRINVPWRIYNKHI